MGESTVRRPHTPSPILDLAFSEQPENEHEDKYGRDDSTAEFICGSTSQTSSQQVIHKSSLGSYNLNENRSLIRDTSAFAKHVPMFSVVGDRWSVVGDRWWGQR
jgi:hypothetical protein